MRYQTFVNMTARILIKFLFIKRTYNPSDWYLAEVNYQPPNISMRTFRTSQSDILGNLYVKCQAGVCLSMILKEFHFFIKFQKLLHLCILIYFLPNLKKVSFRMSNCHCKLQKGTSSDLGTIPNKDSDRLIVDVLNGC